MKAQIDNWSIVVIGAWNAAILSPAWLTEHLGIKSQVLIEFPVGDLRQPLRFTLERVRMVVTRDRLILSPISDETASLEQAEVFARKILQTLTHTPVSAVGINFQFIETAPSPDLSKLFSLVDATKLAGVEFVTQATEIRRRLKNNDQIVNLTLAHSADGGIQIDLNVHRDVQTTADAAAFLEGKIVKWRNSSLKLLADTYGVELEEEQ